MKRFLSLFMIFVLCASGCVKRIPTFGALGGVATRNVIIQEEDADPKGKLRTLKVPDTSLTKNSEGNYSIDYVGGSLPTTFLKLDASNDPLTGSLEGTDLTLTGALLVDTPTLAVNLSGYPDRVGIGTTTPDSELEISGIISQLKVTETGSTIIASANIALENDVGDTLFLRIFSDSHLSSANWGKILTAAGLTNGLQIVTDAGDIALLPTANVGIGTVTPAQELHIIGDGTFEDDTPNIHLWDSDTGDGYMFHLDTDAQNAPWQNFALWRLDGTVSSPTVNPNKPLMQFDDDNIVYFPAGQTYKVNKHLTSLGYLASNDGAAVNPTNTYLGLAAGRYSSGGYKNTCVGANAGTYLSTGYENVIMGHLAGYSNTTGYVNTFIGSSAGYSNTTAKDNVYIGRFAGKDGTTGTANTCIGTEAGTQNVDGDYNVYVGTAAGMYNSDGARNVVVGTSAGIDARASFEDSVFVGYQTGTDITTGIKNTIIGFRAGRGITDENYNTFLGSNAGYVATGSNNVCIGFDAGYKATGNNTAVGTKAGFSLTSLGTDNVFLGYNAGYYETGSDKLFIDNQARSDEDDAREKALIYGVFDADPANQDLVFNADVGIGTTNPSAELDLSSGDFITTGTVTATQFTIGVNDLTTTEWGRLDDVTTNQLIDWTGASAGTIHTDNYIENADQDLFKTITGITNDVVADTTTDSLTLTGAGIVTVVGTTATDTITFTGTEAQTLDDVCEIGGTTDVDVTFTGTISSTTIICDTSTLVANAVGYADKVGIGTTTPAVELDVAGDITLTGTLAVNGDNITCDGDLTVTPAGGDINFASCEVGIGVADPLAPTHIYAVEAAAAASEALRLQNTGGGVGTGAALDFYHGSGAGNKNARIRASGTGANQGDLILEVANTNFVTALTLDGSTTNIIGIFDSPATNYTRIAIDGAANCDSQISFMDNGTSMWSLGNDSGTDDFIIREGAGAFGTTDRFVVEDATGDVGINDADPDHRLEVLDTGTQLRLTHTEDTDYLDFAVDSNGDATFTPSGGDAVFVGTLQATNYKSGDGSAGIDTTFLDQDGNTITVKDGLIVSKVAP